jgi:hypothetical protein
MKNDKPALVLAQELVRLTEDVAKDLFSIILPPPTPVKRKWCQCTRCGQWHLEGK